MPFANFVENRNCKVICSPIPTFSTGPVDPLTHPPWRSNFLVLPNSPIFYQSTELGWMKSSNLVQNLIFGLVQLISEYRKSYTYRNWQKNTAKRTGQCIVADNISLAVFKNLYQNLWSEINWPFFGKLQKHAQCLNKYHLHIIGKVEFSNQIPQKMQLKFNNMDRIWCIKEAIYQNWTNFGSFRS